MKSITWDYDKNLITEWLRLNKSDSRREMRIHICNHYDCYGMDCSCGICHHEILFDIIDDFLLDANMPHLTKEELINYAEGLDA